MEFNLEKFLWTEADFDQMGWHDCNIYELRFTDNELEMDIDYIFQWNEPEIESLPYSFWVAPATLVFINVRNLTFDMIFGFRYDLAIDNLEQTLAEHCVSWTLITQNGNIQFEADGYQQYIRQKPSFQFGQTIPYLERFGYSLERTTSQDNPNLLRDDIVKKRETEWKDYESAKKRQQKRLELEALKKARENNEIDLKNYLSRKKEISEIIDSYDFYLRETRFSNW